jgi:hypothetical protein
MLLAVLDHAVQRFIFVDFVSMGLQKREDFDLLKDASK